MVGVQKSRSQGFYGLRTIGIEKLLNLHLRYEAGPIVTLHVTQSQGTDASSLERLQWMGFGPEIAKVALHVSSGDERKALELCMSGGGAFLLGGGFLGRKKTLKGGCGCSFVISFVSLIQLAKKIERQINDIHILMIIHSGVFHLLRGT